MRKRADARRSATAARRPPSGAAGRSCARSLHGFSDHAAEAAVREGDLERAGGLGERAVDLVDLRARTAWSARCVAFGARLDDREHDALVLGRRQLALREHVERHDQQRDDRPQRQHHRAVARACRPARACSAPRSASKRRLIQPGEAALGVAGAQQPRGHHRRQRQRHDAGDDHGAGQRERELAEQRAGQPALDADRRVDRRQRDGHRDDRPDQLARGVDRRLDRALPLRAGAARRSRPSRSRRRRPGRPTARSPAASAG